jgi:glycolate oxidase FAD binding subunit
VGFVTSEGALVKGGGRVVKNVAGYDFPRLLTGSLGTLGVITQLTLKVRPRPESSSIVLAEFRDAGPLTQVLENLNTSATRPIAVELLNPSAARRIGVSVGFQPEGWVLAVGFEDNADSVTWQIDRLADELRPTSLAVYRDEDAAPLWGALIGFQAEGLGPLCAVANIRPSSVAAFAADLDPARWAVQAHAGNGIVRLQALDPAEIESLALEINRLRARAVADGGNLVLSRCPAEWKGRLKVWGEPRADWALAERVKNALDPLGAMNPGRFVGKI